MQKLKITIVGAGNVSSHLALNFYNRGFSILQIFSRDINNAKSLADKVNASAINSIVNLDIEADLILLCVSDKAISDVINQIKFQPKLIAHSAGSVSLNSLNKFKNYGVFYPLQSFSKDSDLNMNNTPFCIEANNLKNKGILIDLAGEISDSIFELNSEQRLQCHLAAVFANNFSNHMYHVAEQLLIKNEIPFEILKPLILETANKVQKISPSLVQTGPAFRNDLETINIHREHLSSSHLEKIYSFVSQSIWDLKKGKAP